jgi:hypothetical protein
MGVKNFGISNNFTVDLCIFFRERLRKKKYLNFSVTRKFYVDLSHYSLNLSDPDLMAAKEKLLA